MTLFLDSGPLIRMKGPQTLDKQPQLEKSQIVEEQTKLYFGKEKNSCSKFFKLRT